MSKWRDEWKDLVGDMDIPDHIKIGLPDHFRWFVKHGAVLNSKHPNFNEALEYAKKQTRHGSWGDEGRYY